MRLLFAALLAVASFGCSDGDDGDNDAGSSDSGSDAATQDPDADVPSMDARVTDASDEDASELPDASDGGACLEGSYIWGRLEECFDERPEPIARRETLTKLCEDLECPADWNAALAVAAACDEDVDAGSDECWTATTECGADLLSRTVGPNGSFIYYEHETGLPIGAAVQLTDEAEDCVPSEIIAGERPPSCCADAD